MGVQESINNSQPGANKESRRRGTGKPEDKGSRGCSDMAKSKGQRTGEADDRG